MRIAVVAPSNQLSDDVPSRVLALAAARYGERAPEIVFHPQCFLSAGHFAGADQDREDALVAVANDPAVDAVWFARGGYGANRIAQGAVARMGPAARAKRFVGYSDGGFVLAALLRKRVGQPVHGPMTADIRRDGGEATVARVLDYLVDSAVPPLAGDFYFGQYSSEPPATEPPKVAAFNLSVLGALLGTPLQPSFAGRVLMVEEVGEEMYRIDRLLFEVTSNRAVRRCAGLMLGRCAIKPNVDGPDWGPATDEDSAKRWCAQNRIAWLGRADIGHDADNKVVPFG